MRVNDGTVEAPVHEVYWCTINGAKDRPAIASSPTSSYLGAVTEDGTLTAGGTLVVTDDDVSDTLAYAAAGAYKPELAVIVTQL